MGVRALVGFSVWYDEALSGGSFSARAERKISLSDVWHSQ